MSTMRITIARSRFAVAAALFVALAQTLPAAAQQPPPDVRGSYPVAGIVSIYGCTFQGGETITVPFSAVLTVTDQDGDAIQGNLGNVQEPNAVTFVGRVSSEGLIEGSWSLTVTGGEMLGDPTFRGEIAGGKANVDFTAILDVGADESCQYRISVASESATLSWTPPDPNAATALPPPRALTIVPNVVAPPKHAGVIPGRVRRDGSLTGYNVYRSSTPNVQTTPENLFTSVPATQTSIPTSVDSSGSFFVVTATYDEGESDPTNEVSGGVPAATLGPVKVTTKIAAKGSGFSRAVQVFVDGIPFASAAKVKPGGTKVVQKGALVTGQTLSQYITPGKTVAITFRNENGGVATYVYTKP